MNSLPLVSVFIPVYNAEKYIRQAIDSVLAQTYQNYELVIINDASTDDTATVINQYENHPRIRIYQNPTNLGLAGNTNRGIKLCRGDVLTRLDADDFYAPEYLEKVLSVFDHPSSPAMVFTGAQLVFADGATRTELPYRRSWIKTGREFLPQILRYCPIRAPSVSVRRCCYERFGGVLPELKIHIDWELWARIAANCGHIGYIADPLTYYRVLNPGGCTSSAIVDATSPADCTIWLEYMANDNLPYHLNDEEMRYLKQGMYDIVMFFAVFAQEANLTDSMEKHLQFAQTMLPPDARGTMRARLYARAAEVYFMETNLTIHGWRMFLQSMKYSLPPLDFPRYFKLWARAIFGNKVFNFVREHTVARRKFPYGYGN